MSFCRTCGNPLGESERFCANCGQPASQAGAGMPPETPQPYAPGQPYGRPAYAPPPKRSRKGLWIGLTSALLVVVIACLLVFVVFRDDIFNGDGSASNSPVASANLSAKSSPSAIMASSMAALGSSESVTGTFDLEVTIEADTSTLPAEQAKMYAEPWTLSGTMAYKNADQAGDFDIGLGMMGQTMDAEIKLLGNKAWIGLADQWYEMPSDMEQQLADSGVSDTLASVQTMFSSLAIDPTGWLKTQATVQEEKIDGVKVLHISGSDPDWASMVGDIAKIMMSPEFQSLMDSSGSTGSSLESQLPSPAELLQLGSQLDSIFKNVTVDIWVEKDTAVLRKAAIVCDIVPPADTSSLGDGSSGALDLSGSGIISMSLDATITLNPNEPVKVKAPDSAKTYDELQADLQANPALLGPLGGMLSGMGSGQ